MEDVDWNYDPKEWRKPWRAFERFLGVVRVEGRALEVRDLLGWAEEFSHRW
jgi:hypothetical protein